MHTAPVLLSKSPNGARIATNAIHDSGASCTILDKTIAEKLELTGTETPMTLETFGPDQVVKSALEVKLYVFDSQGKPKGQLEATVIPQFVDVRAVDWEERKAEFDHLKEITVQTPVNDGKCGILVGNNCARLFAPVEPAVMINENNEPMAIKSQLGWSVAGPTFRVDVNNPWKREERRALLAKSRAREEAKVEEIREQAGSR